MAGPPPLPNSNPNPSISMDATAENGHGDETTPISDDEIREEFAHHAPGVARINNGSFGSCPASVLAAQLRWQRLYLRQPDDFYFNHLRPAILRSRSLIKNLINATHIDEISLLDNATTAVAVVLQRTSWSFIDGVYDPGDAVLLLHHAYGAVKKAAHAYITRAGGRVVESRLPFPVTSDEEIIHEFRCALAVGNSNGRKVRLAVIDHITSMPSVVIPVKELTRLCRDAGVDQVFVDGAHSIGSVPVDVQDIGADFYTSNLHKWLFSPPSVAILYSRSGSASAGLHHPVVSHDYGNGLPLESSWVGTRDYSAQLVVPDVLEFVNRFEGGVEGIRTRNHERVVEMGKMMAESWGTGLGSPPGMCSSMVMVGLPSSLGISSDNAGIKLRDHLREEFKIQVHIYVKQVKDGEVGADEEGDGVTGYARISHQVYNVVDDYCRLRDAVLHLVQDGFH